MSVAYLILVHKEPPQIGRLVRRLASPGSHFFIHVDRRASDRMFSAVSAALAGVPGVQMTPRRAVHWGVYDTLNAQLMGVATAMGSGAGFTHLCHLTGQDYPLRHGTWIAEFLDGRHGVSFLEHFPMPRLPGSHWRGAVDERGWGGRGGLERWQRWHYRVGHRIVSVPNRFAPIPIRRRFPRGLRPFGGYPYWILAREHAVWLMAYLIERPEVLRFFRRVRFPDEIFFPTVFANSPFADAFVNEDVRVVKWDEPSDGHPRILTMADLPELQTSSKIFARKFDPTVDAAVLDEIDRRLLRESPPLR